MDKICKEWLDGISGVEHQRKKQDKNKSEFDFDWKRNPESETERSDDHLM